MIYFSKHIALWKCHFSTNIELTPTNGLMSNFIQIKDFHTLKKKKKSFTLYYRKDILGVKNRRKGKEEKNINYSQSRTKTCKQEDCSE